MPATPDLSEAEIVEFETVGAETKTRVRLKDGTMIDLRWPITQVFRTGNDPQTGFPLYQFAWNFSVTFVEIGKGVRKRPLKAPGPGEGTPRTGVG